MSPRKEVSLKVDVPGVGLVEEPGVSPVLCYVTPLFWDRIPVLQPSWLWNLQSFCCSLHNSWDHRSVLPNALLVSVFRPGFNALLNYVTINK